MERLDAAQARDHLDLVERILSESHPRLCAGGEYFLVWGVASAFVTVLFALAGRGALPQAALWAAPAVLLAAVVFSILRGKFTQRELRRASLVQREFFNVLWLTIGLAFVATVAANHIFVGLASAAIWSVAEAIVLLYIGMHGNRRAQVAGIVMVASLIAANFAPPNVAGFVLGAGMLVGYAGFGVVELLARD